MSCELQLNSDFYQATRRHKPATRMMTRAFIGVSLLGVWAALTPINESVMQSVTIVPDTMDESLETVSRNPDALLSGEIVAVCAVENQVIKAGDLLLQIDAHPFEVQQAALRAKIEDRRNELAAEAERLQLKKLNYQARTKELESQLASAQANLEIAGQKRQIQIQQAKVSLSMAAKTLRRGLKLQQQKAVSQLEFDQMRTDHDAAEQALAMAELPIDESRIGEIQSSLRSLETGHALELHEVEVVAASKRSELEQLDAELDLLKIKISQCRVAAPCDGVLTACDVKVGDWVNPGELPVTVSPNGFMVEAMVPSNAIGNLQTNNPATITLDGIDWMMHGQISGTVDSVSSEIVRENLVSGDGMTRPIGGYRVWIRLNDGAKFDAWDRVRLGMTGSAEIQTGRKQLVVYLFEKAFGKL